MKKQRSLRWQLTLLIGLLTTVACLTLSYAISSSAILSMSEIEHSVITVLPTETINGDESAHTDLRLDITGDLSEQVRNTKSDFWQKSLFITLLITLVSSALTYCIVGYALRPLHQFGKQVEEIQAKNMQQSIDVDHASSELAGLTDAFNGMMHRLSDAFFIQRQFSANAAHELRTPLAIMQTKMEVLQKKNSPSPEEYAETLEMMKIQTERLSHVVDVLLEMTELQTAKQNDHISLSELTEEVVCDLMPLCQQKGINIIQHPGDAQIYGSYVLIYRAIFNLVENAIKYNYQDGEVIIRIESDAGFARVFISNTGPAIEKKYHKRIFEPFFRADKSRSRDMGGAGLGLALVKEIAHQHGGGVRVIESSAEGTRIELYMLH